MRKILFSIGFLLTPLMLNATCPCCIDDGQGPPQRAGAFYDRPGGYYEQGYYQDRGPGFRGGYISGYRGYYQDRDYRSDRLDRDSDFKHDRGNRDNWDNKMRQDNLQRQNPNLQNQNPK